MVVVEIVVIVVVVGVQTDDLTRMFVHTRPWERRKRGRTPGSQTPGVPATLGLKVQMDGGRKMLQNCSKNTPSDALDRDADERI